MKIKTFLDIQGEELDEQINNWISEENERRKNLDNNPFYSPIVIIDIKFSTNIGNYDGETFFSSSVLVIYK